MILIPVKSKKGTVYAAIDDEDYPKVKNYKWRLFDLLPGSNYAVASTGQRFHRLIMSAPAGVDVDHIDGDGLNNRKANLRLCNASQNGANSRRRIPKDYSSKYRGVYFDKDKGAWRAQLSKNYKKFKSSRHFSTELEAAKAYNELARKHHGEFAKLHEVD